MSKNNKRSGFGRLSQMHSTQPSKRQRRALEQRQQRLQVLNAQDNTLYMQLKDKQSNFAQKPMEQQLWTVDRYSEWKADTNIPSHNDEHFKQFAINIYRESDSQSRESSPINIASKSHATFKNNVTRLTITTTSCTVEISS